MTSASVEPCGRKLVDIMADENRMIELKEIALNLPDISLNDRQICDFELIASGAFSPLKGFMTKADYVSVIENMHLENGLLWPVPICLDIDEKKAGELKNAEFAAIRDSEGFLLAIMHIKDIWQYDRKKEALSIYGTTDTSHPGVYYLTNKSGSFYAGGNLEILSLPLHYDSRQMRMTPKEVRAIYKKLGWQKVVGFHTRDPIHRPQFEMTIMAMRKARANLLILPCTGVVGPNVSGQGDFDHYTRVRCYSQITGRYPADSFILNLLPLAFRTAGPKSALLHSIIARNYGCTHFIVGSDHATPPNLNMKEEPFYKKNEAATLTEKHSKETGVSIIAFEEIVYLPFEDEYCFVSHAPDEAETISLSDSDIRKRIKSGKKIPDWATFPEVVKELQKAYPPPEQQGFTVFLTGLSGAGKSTIARILYSRFLEAGNRPVTLLDGDIVRKNLSSELSFTRKHRDINVRRIGYVASEITKNKGIAICAPIAPYSSTRNEIRKQIETYGGFIEIYVATPLKECEKRDRKGMYAKARAGLIKGFTGVDDPYETPKTPEVIIDTTGITPDEAAQEIQLFITQKGFI